MKLAPLLTGYQSTIVVLLHELFRCIWEGYDFNNASELEDLEFVFLHAKPFFVTALTHQAEAAQARVDVERLVGQMDKAARELKVARKTLSSNRRILDVISQRNAFSGWRDVMFQMRHNALRILLRVRFASLCRTV